MLPAHTTPIGGSDVSGHFNGIAIPLIPHYQSISTLSIFIYDFLEFFLKTEHPPAP
jgi:hypothetical protein